MVAEGEGTVWNFGEVMYTLLYLKRITNKDLRIAHGTLLNVTCQPGWEGGWVRIDTCMEKAMAPHSSTLAWKIPCTEEPGRLQSMGSLRVRHD